MRKFENEANKGQDSILTFIEQSLEENKKNRELNQKQLCDLVGISVSSFIRYKNKATPMPVPVMLEILEALDTRFLILPNLVPLSIKVDQTPKT